MRRKISNLVPRFLILVLDFWKLPGSSKRSNFYATLDEARKECDPQTYQSEDLVDVVVEKTLRFVDLMENGTIDLLTLRTLVPFASIGFGASLRVVDFGGGAGYHYFVARKVLPKSVALSWNIIETKSMSARCQEVFRNRSETQELSFYSSIELANLLGKDIDIVFSSGALCFAPDPADSLKDLVGLGAKYIFITRTPFSEGGKLFSVHKSRLRDNGPGHMPEVFNDRPVTYPISFESRTKIEEILNSSYQIRFRIDEGSWGLYPDSIRTWGYFCERKIA